jgi:hypothetical protein
VAPARRRHLNIYDSSFSRIDPSEIGIPPDIPPPEVKHDGPRGISTREHNLLKDVYGDHLEYGKIQLVANALLGTGSTRTVGNTIEFQHDTISDHTLVHEAGHVYQYQRGDHYAASALWAQGVAVFLHWDRGAAYDYSDEVAKRVPFDNWNAEQQAQWIADKQKAPAEPQGRDRLPLTDRSTNGGCTGSSPELVVVFTMSQQEPDQRAAPASPCYGPELVRLRSSASFNDRPRPDFSNVEEFDHDHEAQRWIDRCCSATTALRDRRLLFRSPSSWSCTPPTRSCWPCGHR